MGADLRVIHSERLSRQPSYLASDARPLALRPRLAAGLPHTSQRRRIVRPRRRIAPSDVRPDPVWASQQLHRAGIFADEAGTAFRAAPRHGAFTPAEHRTVAP